MAKKESFTLFVLGMLLITLVVIAISTPVNLSVPAVNLSLSAPPEEATNADQARWDAMGDFYARVTGVRTEEATNADQARWDAIGDFYARVTGVRTEEATNADQARWDAKGELNTELVGVRLKRAFEADQARWDAIGEFYQNQGLVIEN